MRHLRITLLPVLLFLSLSLTGCKGGDRYGDYELVTRNTILIIGDGMGPEQVRAASYYKGGTEGLLSFHTLPYRSEMTTHSYGYELTDSAASATAMATGQKVFNGALSLARPGSGRTLPTILEIASARGKMTGLVTTCYITHATPAAFASHVENRSMTEEIAYQYMKQTEPDVLLGGGDSALTEAIAQQYGYTTVSDRSQLLAAGEATRLLGRFGEGHMPYMYDSMGDLPELSDMALTALDILEEDQDGFFLMIEGGRIDHAGHGNDLVRNIHETLELSDTVEKVLAWAAGREDTTIIVTADHETGGLVITGNRGAGEIPDHRWTTTGHTGTSVPVYIWGPRAREQADLIRDNSHIFNSLVTERPY